MTARMIPFPLIAPLAVLAVWLVATSWGDEPRTVDPPQATVDLHVEDASVRYREDVDLLVFEQWVVGDAGWTRPEPRGERDGAPVLAYVFPTTLPPAAAGFGDVEGTLALVATSHPDFDDTPLWDEDGNGERGDDGGTYHSHWVVLTPDERTGAGLSVQDLGGGSRPATHPGALPVHVDSPGFTVLRRGHRIRILAPAWRIEGDLDFRYDALTGYLEVNEDGSADAARPLLGVYEVYDALSGDPLGDPPYRVEGAPQ